MTVAADLALALDPVALSREAGIEPDDWQADVLRSAADRLLLNCCRQSGKSTTAGLVAAHTALYRPGSLTLMLSPSQRQSAELFRKAADVYRDLDKPIPAEAESALRLELSTGSRIVSLPGKEQTVRGFSPDVVIVDEAARVSDELYRAITPMLATTGGRLVALSTPFGKRGWFFEEWTRGQGWERVTVTANECPRITREFLEEERRRLGERWFQQEYFCS